MNAENILQSDLLDIIFENRNKQYGAYPLRKEYNKRLFVALGLIASLVALLLTAYKIQNRQTNFNKITGGILDIRDSVVLKRIELQPLQPPALQKKLAPAATITNPPPLIVPDNQLTDTSTHNAADLDNKVISDVSADGPATGSNNQAAPDKPGAGAATVAAPEELEAPAVLDNAEIMPEYPGGISALLRFLGKNLQVPEDALEPGQKVRVPVKFVVNRDGLLSDVAFITQTDPLLRKEILRVMAKMPRWKPASQQGVKVAVYYTIPVIFDMGEN